MARLGISTIQFYSESMKSASSSSSSSHLLNFAHFLVHLPWRLLCIQWCQWREKEMMKWNQIMVINEVRTTLTTWNKLIIFNTHWYLTPISSHTILDFRRKDRIRLRFDIKKTAHSIMHNKFADIFTGQKKSLWFFFGKELVSFDVCFFKLSVPVVLC